jgi:hypothetical protein
LWQARDPRVKIEKEARVAGQHDSSERDANVDFSYLFAQMDHPDARATVRVVQGMRRDLSAVAEIARLAGEDCPPVMTFFST